MSGNGFRGRDIGLGGTLTNCIIPVARLGLLLVLA